MRNFLILGIIFCSFVACDDGDSYLDRLFDPDAPIVLPSMFYMVCGTEFLETKTVPVSTLPIVSSFRKTCLKLLSPEQLEGPLNEVVSEMSGETTFGEYELCSEKLGIDSDTDRQREELVCVNIDIVTDTNTTVQEILDAEFPGDMFE